uniref:Major core capsid protein n=1 Tax=Diaphorina citri reovirus TaxID=557218 RepID=A0A0U3U726_9REOV|nr:major core capsid protein [Diaphorina citri reovirus]
MNRKTSDKNKEIGLKDTLDDDGDLSTNELQNKEKNNELKNTNNEGKDKKDDNDKINISKNKDRVIPEPDNKDFEEQIDVKKTELKVIEASLLQKTSESAIRDAQRVARLDTFNILLQQHSNEEHLLFLSEIDTMKLDSVAVPYYRFIDKSSSTDPNGIFKIESFHSDYLNPNISAQLTAEDISRNMNLPVIDNALNVYKSGTYKVLAKWNNQSDFLGNMTIDDPGEVTDNLLMGRLVFADNSNTDVMLGRIHYTRFKTFNQLIANSNIIWKNCTEWTLSIHHNNANPVTERLDTVKIISLGLPHPSFAAAFSYYLPLHERVGELYGIEDEDPVFNVETTKFFGHIKIENRARIPIDQYSSRFIINARNRLDQHGFTYQGHLRLIRPCYPLNYHFINTPANQYSLRLVYMPVDEQIFGSLFYIICSSKSRDLLCNTFIDVLTKRNLLQDSTHSLEVFQTILNQETGHDIVINNFVADLASAISMGNTQIFLTYLAFDFFNLGHFKFNIMPRSVPTPTMNIVILIEIVSFFIFFPKIAWRCQVQLGKMIIESLSTIVGDQVRIYCNRIGLFRRLNENGFFQNLPLNIASYTEEDLIDNNIYFTFFTPANIPARDRNICPFLTNLYQLITPEGIGEQVLLATKQAAHLPYFRRNYNYYLPYVIRNSRDGMYDLPIALRLSDLLAEANRLFRATVPDIRTKTSTKAFNGIIEIYKNNLLDTARIFHVVIAPNLQVLANSYLLYYDTFDVDRPFIVAPEVNIGSTRQQAGGAIFQNQTIRVHKRMVSVSVKMSDYIVFKQSSVLKRDNSQRTGPILHSESKIDEVLPFPGDIIFDVQLRVINESCRFNEMWYVISSLAAAELPPNQDVMLDLREFIRDYFSNSTSKIILGLISEAYGFNLTDFFKISLNSFDLRTDTRLAEPGLFFANMLDQKFDDQDEADYHTNESLTYTDEYFQNTIRIANSLIFSDVSPIKNESVGITFGIFDLLRWDRDVTYLNCELNFRDSFVLGETAIFDLVSIENEPGVILRYTIIRPDQQRLSWTVESMIDTPHILIINNIADLNPGYVKFVSNALQLNRIHVSFPTLIYTYEITHHLTRNDINQKQEFEKWLTPSSLNRLHMVFIDTAHSRNNDITQRIIMRYKYHYLNRVALAENVIATDLTQINSVQPNRMSELSKSMLSYGMEDGTLCPERGIDKLDTGTVNINNSIYYYTADLVQKLPVILSSTPRDFDIL